MENMARSIRKGDRVTIVATDPWELVSVIGDVPISGRVVEVDQIDHDAVIIELDRPLSYAGHEASFFLAKPRRLGAKFGDDNRQQAFCGLTSITPQQAAAGVPQSPGSLKGDLMLIGDIAWHG